MSDTINEVAVNVRTAGTCPACGTETGDLLFTDRNRREGLPITGSYARCHGCDLIYLTPRPTREELSEMYDHLFVSQKDLSRTATATAIRSSHPSFVKKLTRYVRKRPHSWPLEAGKGRRLLDVGCGDASKLIEFAQRGWEVWGIDVSPAAIEQAKANVPSGRFIVGELGAVKLPERSFTVVRLDNVLEHIPDPGTLLTECRRLLRPDGRIHIYVPHGRSLSMRTLGRYSATSWIPFHICLFTPPSLETLLRSRGYAPIRVTQFSPPDWWPSSIKQLLRIHPQKRLNQWVEAALLVLTLPLGTLTAHLGCGEELVAIAGPAGSGSA